jgi:beta-N-acetylhexosaminidase
MLPCDEEVIQAYDLLSKGNMGGVILYSHNINDPEQLLQLNEYLHKASPSAFLALDQEGGKVQRLTVKKGFLKQYPTALSISNNSIEEARKIYSELSEEIASYSFNLNFAPVVDLHNPESKVIGGLERSFSKDPAIIHNYAKTCIEAHHNNGVYTCIKHFPGHGLALGDTHHGLVDATNYASSEELEPYYSLIKGNKVDMVMTAHIMNRNLDADHPVTLSDKIIKNLLRDKGYNGVVIADDLLMKAIANHYSLKESVVSAIKAGCDILLFSRHPFFIAPDHPKLKDFVHEIRNIILEAVNNGQISENQIMDSYNRINNLKLTKVK